MTTRVTPGPDVVPTGYVQPGFEAVRDAFVEGFRTRGEVGAAIALYVNGRLVVDLVGGVADIASGRAYDRDALQLVFSTTKGLTALTVHKLVELGALDLDAPITTWWPEFGGTGKGSITLRMVLSHRAGVPVLDANLSFEDLLDPERIDVAVEAQAPLWPPDSRHGYHPLTYGWIIDGVVRRATGASIADLFRREFGVPLGLDCWIGVPAEHVHRVVPVIDMPRLQPKLKDLRPLVNPKALRALLKVMKVMRDPHSTANRGTYINGALKPPDGSLIWNDQRLWSAAWPAATAITDARSLARIYAACVSDVDGIRALSPATVATAVEEASFGSDATSILPSRFGLGFHLHHEFAPMLGTGSFGHGGMGGSQAFADVDHTVGFGYVMNQMRLDGQRAQALVAAVRSCLW